MENKKETICAVVVTYNRKKLLLECLEALLKQTRPVQGVYLIDNASTDGTPELLLEKGCIKKLPPENLTRPWEKEFEIKNLIDGQVIKLHYVRMHKNTGGAGGFHEGVKRAYKKGYDWLWLMDDDVVVQKNSLEKLVKAKNILVEKKKKIGFLCSRVVSEEGEEMNVPLIDMKAKQRKYCQWGKFLEHKMVKVSAATFVSVLIPSHIVKEIGFPIKNFFIWGDDIEYTLRITQKYSAYLVGDSVVIHKRKITGPPDIILDNNPFRIKNFYYFYRNGLYIYKKHFKKYKIFLLFGKYFLDLFQVIFSKSSYKFMKVKVILKGTVSFLFFKPEK